MKPSASIVLSHLRKTSSSNWRIVHHVDLVVLNRWHSWTLAVHHVHASLASVVSTRHVFHGVSSSDDILIRTTAWAMNHSLTFQGKGSSNRSLRHVSASIDVILILTTEPEQSRFAIIYGWLLWNDIQVDLTSCWSHLSIVAWRLTASVSVTISQRMITISCLRHWLLEVLLESLLLQRSTRSTTFVIWGDVANLLWRVRVPSTIEYLSTIVKERAVVDLLWWTDIGNVMSNHITLSHILCETTIVKLDQSS